jgi:circadian clock protein KaiB
MSGGEDAPLELRLYITGASPRSLRAIRNIQEICAALTPDQYSLEIVDVYKQPQVAVEHDLLAAPTLVKLAPPPVRRLVGDLSDQPVVKSRLGMDESDDE